MSKFGQTSNFSAECEIPSGPTTKPAVKDTSSWPSYSCLHCPWLSLVGIYSCSLSWWLNWLCLSQHRCSSGSCSPSEQEIRFSAPIPVPCSFLDAGKAGQRATFTQKLPMASPAGLFPCRASQTPAGPIHGMSATSPRLSQIFVCFPAFLLLTLQEQSVHAGTCIQMSPCGWQLNHASPIFFFFLSSNPSPR